MGLDKKSSTELNKGVIIDTVVKQGLAGQKLQQAFIELYNNYMKGRGNKQDRLQQSIQNVLNTASTTGYGRKMTKKTQYKTGGNKKEKMNRLKQFLSGL